MLTRSTRSVTLTHAGQVRLEHCRRLVRTCEQEVEPLVTAFLAAAGQKVD